MKKLSRAAYTLLVLCAGILIGGAGIGIASGILATPRTTTLTINGDVSNLEGYIIDGRHYFQLDGLSRELDGYGAGFALGWDNDTRTASIDTASGYFDTEPEQAEGGIRYTSGQTVADGSGSISDTPLTTKVLDGGHLSREDFSQDANPAVFDELYTREAYNTIRQTYLDKGEIVKTVNEKAINPYYSYASTTASVETRHAMQRAVYNLGEYYRFETGVETYRSGQVYLYDGYFICKVNHIPLYEEANTATDEFVERVKGMTDAEKVKACNDYVCDVMTYIKGEASGPNIAFTSSTPSGGMCGSYSTNFQYLCDRVGIPCIKISGDNHAWNAVYVKGKWSYVDCVANDVGDNPDRRNAVLMADSVPETDELPKTTAFIKEILVPGSTK